MGFNISSLLTDDEERLIKRCRELFLRADEGVAGASHFLNLRERFIIEHQLPSIFSNDESAPLCFFWGGYPNAERTVLWCLPAYSRYSLIENIPLRTVFKDEFDGEFLPLKIKTSGYVKLAHRDFLGSLIGLGIERYALGDILPDETGAVIFASLSVSVLIKNELTYIGRDKVKVTDITLPDDFNFERTFENFHGTVASPRLDAVVSELARTSRESAKGLIRDGLVEHNHFTASEADREVTNGDIISIRKSSGTKGGKFIIDSLDEKSSKGRIRLAARRFV